MANCKICNDRTWKIPRGETCPCGLESMFPTGGSSLDDFYATTERLVNSLTPKEQDILASRLEAQKQLKRK